MWPLSLLYTNTFAGPGRMSGQYLVSELCSTLPGVQSIYGNPLLFHRICCTNGLPRQSKSASWKTLQGQWPLTLGTTCSSMPIPCFKQQRRSCIPYQWGQPQVLYLFASSVIIGCELAASSPLCSSIESRVNRTEQMAPATQTMSLCDCGKRFLSHPAPSFSRSCSTRTPVGGASHASWCKRN